MDMHLIIFHPIVVDYTVLLLAHAVKFFLGVIFFIQLLYFIIKVFFFDLIPCNSFNFPYQLMQSCSTHSI